MVTKAILRDRIRKILSGGFPSDRDRVKDNEIILAIGDTMGALLKAQAMDITMNYDGDNSIEGSLIATYENNTVERANGTNCKIKLPASPMYLPEHMGVYSVYPSGQPDKAFRFVPPNIYPIWIKERLVSPVSNQLFTWSNGYITVYQDLIGDGIGSVDIQLAISDIDRYGPNDVLPLSSDMVPQLIEQVCTQFGMEPSTIRRETDAASPENMKQ